MRPLTWGLSNMRISGSSIAVTLALFAMLAHAAAGQPAPRTSKSRVEAALQNIATVARPGKKGFATVWDGNKYVQCAHRPDRSLRCEAAGTLMQPSLERVLVPERVGRLAALGWRLDSSFGNYVKVFPAGVATSLVADEILRALADGYDAAIAELEIRSEWVPDVPCPSRNGPSQNLAGMVNDAPAMAATAVHACAYAPRPSFTSGLPTASTAALIVLYGPTVSGEIQRLRVNIERNVFVVFDAGIGHVQCRPNSRPPAIYCEAQSAESWPALAAVLTTERVARLHAAGFADPGRAPNYWKTYSADAFDDDAIASELLTILHEVYGYNGAQDLAVKTE